MFSTKGIYVLTDATFKPLGRTSTEKGEGALARAQPVSLFTTALYLHDPFAES